MRNVVAVLVILALAATGFFILRSPKMHSEVAVPQPTQEAQEATPEEVDYTASFEIYTLGTKRIFTAEMYHNQSADVFIQNPDPSIVYVKKAGITWADFFGTLPFSLKKDCLVTGTDQTFCNTETQKLRFTLNGVDIPDALDLDIKSGDKLVVEYVKKN